MSTGQILLLGALAGITIFIGLPMGRVQGISQDVKAFLSANRQDAELTIELFVLEPEPTPA